MYNPKRFLLYGLMILFTSAYLAACQAASPTPLDGVPTPGISVNITSGICPSLKVTASDQITWTNQDLQVHLIHIESAEGKTVFDSGNLLPGDTASLKLPQAGNYVYVCSSGQEATGTITVEP